MPEPLWNPAIRPHNIRSDLALIRQRVTEGSFPLTASNLDATVRAVLPYLESPRPRVALAAARTIAILAGLNVRNARAQTLERQGEARIRLQTLQAAMGTQEGQQASVDFAAALARALAGPQTDDPGPDASSPASAPDRSPEGQPGPSAAVPAPLPPEMRNGQPTSPG
jgi:hypothetical protein